MNRNEAMVYMVQNEGSIVTDTKYKYGYNWENGSLWRLINPNQYWDKVTGLPDLEFKPYTPKPNDKDLIVCWDYDHTHYRALRFYNAKNDGTFSSCGKRYGLRYDNYKPIPREQWPEWAVEAYKTLEG